ncbi:MAG TPA: M28 family peptidase [bacterium]|nr:M28 family peptidase [bacterium]
MSLILLLSLGAGGAFARDRGQRLQEPDPLQVVLDAVSLDSLQLYVKQLSGAIAVTLAGGLQATISSRHAARADNDTAAIWLKEKLESYGLSAVRQGFSSTGFNLYAEQLGWRFPRQKYLLCAHYDDEPSSLPAPGADDNASGCAAVIEAARVMTGHSYPYTIVYALWDEEEPGMLGSSHYARTARTAGDSILGVINLDMIAYDRNNDFHADVHVRPYANSLFLSERMAELNANYSIGLLLNTINPGINNSDHSSFWNQGYGAILFIEDYFNDFNSGYHSSGDTIGQFNLPFFERCSRLALITLTSFAAKTAPDPPLLMQPVHLAEDTPIRSLFQWQETPSATTYHLQISMNSEFTTLVEQASSLTEPQWVSRKLPHLAPLYWRSRSGNKSGSSEWSSPFRFTTTGLKEQQIILQNGWNLVGCGLFPHDSTLTHLMSGVLNHLVMMKDETGQVFWPAMNIDNLHDWRAGRGYWINVNATDTLTVSGDPIHTVPMPIPLHAGWNMPAFLAQNPQATAEAFADILGHFILIKTGNGKVYWPAYGIDQIDSLEPGQSYQVYMTQADTLTYPPETVFKGSTVRDPSPKHFTTAAVTGNNMILLLHAPDLENGDEIAIRTRDHRVIGSAVVAGKQAVLTIWGDDLITESLTEGAREGERLTVLCWSARTGLEREMQIDRLCNAMQENQEIISFVYRSQAILVGEIAGPVENAVAFSLQQNHPNPFNGTTQIRYRLPRSTHVVVEVFNLLGQSIAVLTDEVQPAGEHCLTWQAKHMPSGLYLYRLQTKEFTGMKKMILAR